MVQAFTFVGFHLCWKTLHNVLWGPETSITNWVAGLHCYGEDWLGRVTNCFSAVFALWGSRVPAPRAGIKYNLPQHTPNTIHPALYVWKHNATFILLIFSILFQTFKKITWLHNWFPLTHVVSSVVPFTLCLVHLQKSPYYHFTKHSSLCLPLLLFLLLSMNFIYLVSALFSGWFQEGHTMSFCFVISVVTRLGLRRHTFSASCEWVPLLFCTLGISFARIKLTVSTIKTSLRGLIGKTGSFSSIPR